MARNDPGDDCRRPSRGSGVQTSGLARQLQSTPEAPASADDALALFGASVERNAYGVTTTFTEQDYRRGPGRRPTTGTRDARAPLWWTAEAEKVVLDLTAGGRTVTSDDLRERYSYEPSATGAAIGALFRRMANKGLLQLCGHVPSTRPEARGRVVGIWSRVDSR